MVKITFSVLTLGFSASILLGSAVTPGNTQELNPNIQKQLSAFAAEKASRTPAQKKISSHLVFAIKSRRGDPLVDELASVESTVRVAADDRVLVDMKAKVNPVLLAEIEQAGGEIVNAYEQYGTIRARLPLYAMEELAENDDIRFIEPAARAILRKVNTSEGDAAHSGPAARNKYNLTGRGVKVGVLSDSVDHLAAVKASGDLPNVITVLEDAPGNSGEGTAMLEIVYDLAPEAQLYFATAFNGPSGFAYNINALANAGCQVIVDDVGYLNESPFQDDIISQAVNTVTADGVLYFSSAGNSGNFNDGTSGVWEGNYVPYTANQVVEGYSSVHNFGGGDWSNRIRSSTPFCYTLFWSDPLSSSSNDYDLYLVNPGLTEIVAGSYDIQDGVGDPFEIICPDADTTGYHLLVARWSGTNRFLHLSANRGTLQYRTAGQIVGHPAATDAFGVAAVSARNRTVPFLGNESVETFSTDGPRRVFFNPDGSAITPGNYLATGGMVRQKPDISAADGVKTATPGFNPFYGTSAAAPHAAAIGALMLSGKGSLTVDEARQAFMDTAYDIEAAGWDRDSGYGIIMADRVLDALAPFGGVNPGILYPLLMK